jgi:hypothetical protein
MVYEIRTMWIYYKSVFRVDFEMKSTILRSDSHMHVLGRMLKGEIIFHNPPFWAGKCPLTPSCLPAGRQGRGTSLKKFLEMI